MENSSLTKVTLSILLFSVFISGVSQGMLMPVISIVFEQKGVSSTISGLHASGYYLGILLASPFTEVIIRKIGYKSVMAIGLLLVISSLFAFITFESIIIWFLLRMVIGIGGNMLHLASQTWVTSTAESGKRGIIISTYGLSFGLGFAIGPYASNLIHYSENIPFALLAILSIIVLILVCTLNEPSLQEELTTTKLLNFAERFQYVFKYAWVALLFPFGYGVLESVLNVNLPIYLIREGFELNEIAIIISSFAVGSVVFQIPLGILSDKFSRNHMLSTATLIGSISFFISILYFEHKYILISFLFIAGMFVGSIFSLGIAYLIDLLPKSLIPMGTMLSGVLFSIGSISGPIVGGALIDVQEEFNVLWLFVSLLVILFLVLRISHVKKTEYLELGEWKRW